MPIAHLAIDLGASSGRAILGLLESSSGKLTLNEVHRFEHLACPSPTGPIWDLTGIWQNILIGMRKAIEECKKQTVDLATIGVDAWGVDWALIGPSGELLALPHCYRDPQNQAAMDRVLEKLGGFEPLYERTGIQLMPLNTLFQVAARHACEPKLFDAAHRLIFLPDLFHFWLSGEISTERTIASTSSMLDVESGDWDLQMLNELGLPTDLFGPIVAPGTQIGTLTQAVCEATGASQSVKVITPASHDTGSAIAAVPAVGSESWAYLSSGTWSLLGAELDRPIYNEQARQIPFTNERGVDGSIRLLKNIGGLWLIQELRRDINQNGRELNFAEMVEAAREAEPFRTLVDPNYAEFAAPGNMSQKLQTYAIDSGQPEPQSVGQLVRCCLESLALCYAQTLGQLENVIGESVESLHMVGGGIQNTLLNEFTAEAIERPVITGPVEATAIGNLLVQAIGCGELSGLSELRKVVANSFDLSTLSSHATREVGRRKATLRSNNKQRMIQRLSNHFVSISAVSSVTRYFQLACLACPCNATLDGSVHSDYGDNHATIASCASEPKAAANRKFTLIYQADGEGFEPPVPCGTPVFKTGAFNQTLPPVRRLLR